MSQARIVLALVMLVCVDVFSHVIGDQYFPDYVCKVTGGVQCIEGEFCFLSILTPHSCILISS